jgi:hypothetical protein
MGLIRWLELQISREAINFALDHDCPLTIPLSRSSSNRTNCITVRGGGADSDWPILISSLVDEGIRGKWWDGESYSTECSMPNCEICQCELEFRHYLRGYEFRSLSAVAFAVREVVFWPYIFVICDKFVQWLFNTRHLVRTERMDILRKLVAASSDNREFSIDCVRLISRMHQERTWMHPQLQGLLAYYGTILDSLVVTGDLKCDGPVYRVLPKALVTVSEFECEERRHNSLVRQQRLMCILTFVLAAIGALQAYGAIALLRK